MRKQSRAISFMVILTLIISMFSFSLLVSADTEGGQKTEPLSVKKTASVEKLHALGIISDSDMTLAADDKITRAEFCVWAIKMLGIESLSVGFHYSDVTEEHRAAKYINTACEMKLVAQSDTFQPDIPIQLNEAVKILVNAAGYGIAAEQSGGWPSGYLAMASSNGMLKGVSGKGGEITRLAAAELINNTLNVKMMDTNYNGIYKQTDKTILSECLKIDVYRGNIIEVDKKEQRIKVRINTSEVWYDLAPGIDAALIVEDKADLYISNDRFGESVVYIDFKGEITVSYDFISEVNESADRAEYTTERVRKIYLQNADKEYSMDSDVVIFLNDVNAKDVPVILCGTFARIIRRDSKIFKIEAYSLYEGGILYRADPTMIKYTRGEVNDNAMENLDAIDDLRIYIDGIPHTDMYDLKSDMIFDYYISPEEDKLILVASSRCYTKKLSAVRDDALNFDGVEYAVSKTYGLYVYSNTRMRYQKDGSLDDYIGKDVQVFVDDNMCVRYLKISDDLENASSFLGVLMQISQNNSIFGEESAKLKIFKITGGQGEKIYETDPDRMKKSPIKMAYLRTCAGNTEGKSFLKFTTNSKNQITRVEPIDLWGSTKTFSGSIDKNSDVWLDNLYIRTAAMFAAYEDDGTFKVKMLDWGNDLRDTTFDSPVTIISDYDPMYNPNPKYIMFGKGAESHRSKGVQTGIVEEISYLEDDTVQVKFYNKWGIKTYNLDREFFEKQNLKKNMLVEWYYGLFTEDPIRIHKIRDLSGTTDTWEIDNDSYNSGITMGFYKADKVLYRDGKAVQFMVNGEPTDVLPLNLYPTVYELVRGRDGYKLVENTGINPLGYINSSDNVWFNVVSYDPSPRSVDIVIYEKTSIAGN